MQGKSTYIPRPALDRAIAARLSSGSGVYALEGPGGAGKSAALLHGLVQERERRGKGGRGHVRLLQLWGDEPPSLFAQRLVKEVGFLNLVAYPQPEQLAKLAAEMAQAIPGLETAGKILGSLLPNDDMRPLPLVAAKALGEAGKRSIAEGDPLVIGIDLLGGSVSDPVREFFARLVDLLPETVVLLFAQPGGHNHLISLPSAQRISVGAFSPDQARAFLQERLGRLDADSSDLLDEERLSLLPGDLAQIVNFYSYLGGNRPLAEVLPDLERDIAARYQALFEAQLLRPHNPEEAEVNSQALELVALCAVSARPQQPLTMQQAATRMELRPSALAQLRQNPFVRALCVSTQSPDRHSGWPIEPANAQARDGVRTALLRYGLLEVYEDRWLDALLATLRGDSAQDSLLAGVSALSLLTERAASQPLSLGQAVALLGELETMLWHAGWHRTFAELYDALLPHLRQAGVTPRDVAPQLWFRRARTRIQNIDWAQNGKANAELSLDELLLAQKELAELDSLSETRVMQARVQIGLSTDGNLVSDWCRHLPYKARQARGYASVLKRLHGAIDEDFSTALDDILTALSHFVATQRFEDTAQTLTILGDYYSARADADSDALAIYQYEQGLSVAEQIAPRPNFYLGMTHRSIANHHHRRGREEQAGRAYTRARKALLAAPDARMGTLLASLLPVEQ